MPITWLHLSDLHRGQPGDTRWTALKPSLLDDLAEYKEALGPPDLILFTGDLAYSGLAEQYHHVDDTLDEILEVTGEEAVIVPVPGNHDLSWPHENDLRVIACEKYHEDPRCRTGFVKGLESTVSFFAGLFQGYNEWWERRILNHWRERGLWFEKGMLPGDFLLSYEKEDIKLGIVGMNSAYLDIRGNRDRSLALEYEQISAKKDVPRWIDEHDAALLLMHHPLQSLHESALKTFEDSVYPPSRFLACLAGHNHSTRFHIVSGGGADARRHIQAPSLFGLERYGHGASAEDRRSGYSWANLTRKSAEAGILRRWPRELGTSELGGPLMRSPAGVFPTETEVQLKKKRPNRRAGRHVAVVAVFEEFHSEVSALAARLEPAAPGVVAINAAGNAVADVSKFDVVVVIIGGRVTPLIRAAAAAPTALILRPAALPLSSLGAAALREVEQLLAAYDTVVHFRDIEHAQSTVREAIRRARRRTPPQLATPPGAVSASFPEHLKLRRQEARNEFQRGRVGQSISLYTELLRDVELSDDLAPMRAELRSHLVLRLVQSYVAINDLTQAASRADEIDTAKLAADELLVAARLYQALEKHDKAAQVRAALGADVVDDGAAAHALGEGRIPERRPKSPDLLLQSARLLLEEAKFKTAYEWTVDAHSRAAAENRLLSLQVFNSYVTIAESWAWARSAQEDPLQHSDVKDLLKRAITLSKELEDLDADSSFRVFYLQTDRILSARLADGPRFVSAGVELTRLAGNETEEPPAFRRALDAARAGDPESALALLQEDDGESLVGRMQRVAVKLEADVATAMSELEILLDQFPGVPVLEYEAARQLLGRGRFEEAVAHAQQSFARFPSAEYRRVLAESLLCIKDFAGAAGLFHEDAASLDPASRLLYAQALEVAAPASALEHWSDYVSAKPEEWRAGLHLAALEFARGEPERGAERAWSVATTNPGAIPPEYLNQVALLQNTGGLAEAVLRERLLRIAQWLRDLRDASTEAERYYLSIWLSLGNREELPPPDFERLTRLGVAMPVTSSDIVELVSRRSGEREELRRLYDGGHVPLEYAIENLYRDDADFVSRLGGEVHLVTQHHRLRTGGPAGSRPSHVWMGNVELLAFCRIGILDDVERFIRQGVRLCTFDDCVDRLAQSFVTRAVSRSGSSGRISTQVGDALDGPFVDMGGADSSVEWLDIQAFPASVATLVNLLRDRGEVSASRASRLLDAISSEETEILSATRVGVSIDTLRWLVENELLDAAARVVGRVLVRDEEARAHRVWLVESRKSEAEYELVRQCHAWLGRMIREGLVMTVPRPVPVLPPAISQEFTDARRALEQALAWRIVANDEGHVCLSADALVHDMFADAQPAILRCVRWSREEYYAVKDSVAESRSRVVGLAWAIDSFTAEIQKAALTDVLLTFGCGDAFTPQSLIRLMTEYGAGGVTGRIVALQERSIASPDAARFLMAGVHLAQVYGGALGEAARTRPAAESGEYVAGLLARWQGYGVTNSSWLAMSLLSALLRVAPASFVQTAQGSYALDDTSAVAAATVAMTDWGRRPENLPVLTNAIAELLAALDEMYSPDGPPQVELGPVVLLARRAPPGVGGLRLNEAWMGALAIITATWVENPLRVIWSDSSANGHRVRVFLEDALQRGANLIAAHDKSVELHPAFVRYPYTTEPEIGLSVHAPAEAILLRLPSAQATSFASSVAQRFGASDGTFYRLLAAFAEEPTDVLRKKALARRAIAGPRAVVGRSPEMVAMWGALVDLPWTTVSTAEELMDLLTDQPCGNAANATEHLATLLSGVWAGRADAERLAGMSSQFPGASAFMWARRAVENQISRDVAYALNILRSPRYAHFGEVWWAVIVVWMLCAADRTVDDDGRSSRIRDEFSALIGGLLRDVTAHRQMGVLETSTLRALGAVVVRLEVDVPSLAWMTTRLFSWWNDEARTFGPEACVAHMTALSQRSLQLPGAAVGFSIDNPGTWPSELDVRLAAVTNALAAGSQLLAGWAKAQGLEWKWQAPDDLLQILADVAADDPSTLPAALRGAPATWLEWFGAVSPADNALTFLLDQSPSNFMKLTQAARVQWLQSLPVGSLREADIQSEPLQARLVLACVVCADEMSPIERAVLRERVLESQNPSFATSALGAMLAAQLYALGDLSRSEAWERVAPHVSRADLGGAVVRTYLAGVLERKEAGLVRLVEEVLDRLEVSEAPLSERVRREPVIERQPELRERLSAALSASIEGDGPGMP
jgi:tetratricopeptide (TPR) repeat protein